MKRKTLKFIVCAAVMTLTLSVTACGGSDNAADTIETADEEDTIETADEEDTMNTADGAAGDDETEKEVIAAEEEKGTSEPEENSHLYPDSMYDSATEGLDDEQADAVMDAVDSMVEADTSDFQTLEDYFTDPSIRSAYENVFAAMGQDGIDTSMDVTDNDFIMIFQITDSSLMVDGMAESIAEVLANADLSGQVEAFDDLIGKEGVCTVTMRFVDPDGNVMTEQTYTAN